MIGIHAKPNQRIESNKGLRRVTSTIWPVLCEEQTSNQLYVSESLPTIYSSVVIGAYFASLPGRWQLGRHEIFAPPLGLQKNAIDWR